MNEITSPTLLVDPRKCKKNIARMCEKASANNIKFSPHFKTHQSSDIGEWFREVGVHSITVSSVDMGLYFANHQWRDITVAVPVNILDIDKINKLAEAAKITLMVNFTEVAKALEAGLNNCVDVIIEIDTGYPRTGIKHDDYQAIANILEYIKVSEKLSLKGFYSHAGHTYNARGKDEISTIHGNSIKILNRLKGKFSAQYDPIQLSYGDTPSCSVMSEFPGIDEIRPGNFVFYDLMQQYIGSCKFEEISAIMICPVISKNTQRSEVVVHGGAVHFSKDFVPDANAKVFGKMVKLEQNGWSEEIEECILKSLSQEHGIISITNEELDNIQIGDLVGIVPAHICLCADLMRGYQTTEDGILNHILS